MKNEHAITTLMQKPKKLFNKPWMKNINNDLLRRYYTKVGKMDEFLILEECGIFIAVEKTSLGEMLLVSPPRLTETRKEELGMVK